MLKAVTMPVDIQAFVTSCQDAAGALAELDAQLDAGDVRPDCIFAFYSPSHDDAALHAWLQATFPGVPVIGGSSSAGVMSGRGLAGEHAIGLLTVSDPDGGYGVAATPLGDDPATAAQQALTRALAAADASGELPELVWTYQHPGREEQVIEGLRRVVGDRCPIVGGSSAAQDGVARWLQLGPDGPMTQSLVVAALFPSGGLSFTYQGGFEPTGETGVVTQLGTADPAGDGVILGADRHILQIDGEPAAEVHNRWTGGNLPADTIRDGGQITAASAFWPFGVPTGDAGALTYYRLIHVDQVTPQQGLKTFAGVTEGTRLHAMRGSKDGLVNRASRVAATAVAQLTDEGVQPAGALMAYCVGCRMALADDIARVPGAAKTGFGPVPFLGMFTAGEQGQAMGHNVHGNLMISAVVFGR